MTHDFDVFEPHLHNPSGPSEPVALAFAEERMKRLALDRIILLTQLAVVGAVCIHSCCYF